MSIWEDWKRRADGGRFAAQAIVARRAARLLGTRTGPDDDVLIGGRLVSVAGWVPPALIVGVFDDPLTDAEIDALMDIAAHGFAEHHRTNEDARR